MSADLLLKELRESVLFAHDFPRRHDEAAGKTTIERAPHFRELVDLVRGLGEAQHVAAVPCLAELWNTCGLVPLRSAAGRALLDIGTQEARAALIATIEDTDPVSLTCGVRALFVGDAVSDFDRCAPRFERSALRSTRGPKIAEEILRIFCPSSFRYCSGAEVPLWNEARAPRWFVEESRWVTLCIQLRRDPALGWAAREALRYANKGLVGRALTADLTTNPPIIARPSTASRGELLRRYNAGEHAEVWDELRTAQVLGGALLEEAHLVAQATMERVARAADTLAQRLEARGWASINGPMRESFSMEDASAIQEMERRTGECVPPSVHAFWNYVGAIDFVWNPDLEPPDLGVGLPMEEMDPLFVGSAKSCAHIFEEWEHTHSGVHPELRDPYFVPLAADDLHKAGISGGAPYGVELPFLGADPIFVNEAHELSFVDYLRFCFQWAGFPGLEAHKQRKDVKVFVAQMSDGLQTF